MLPKRCEQCKTFFMPNRADLGSVFCRVCVAECQKAYDRICKYSEENPHMAMSNVVTVLGISNVFVHHLYMDGWLMPDLSKRAVPTSHEHTRECDTCKKTLHATERIYCDGCREEIAQRLQNRSQANVSVEEAVPQTQSQRLKNRLNKSKAKGPEGAN